MLASVRHNRIALGMPLWWHRSCTPAAWSRSMRLGLEGDDHQVGGLEGFVEGAWIGNGVLDSSLEDESLFGEFLRAPVSEGGVETLVVEPPHVVVEVALYFVKSRWTLSALNLNTFGVQLEHRRRLVLCLCCLSGWLVS